MDRDLKTPTNSYSVKRRVVLCIFLAFTSLLAGCDNQTPQEFHTLALQNYEQGKLEDASIQIKNAIRLAPTSAEYRFLLAQIHIKNRDWEGAEKELSRASEFGYSGQDLIRLQSLVYDRLIKYDDQIALKFNSIADTDPLPLYLKLKAFYMTDDRDGFRKAFDLFENRFTNMPYEKLAQALNLMMRSEWSTAKTILEDKKNFDLETEDESLDLLAKVARQLDNVDLLITTIESRLIREPSNYSIRIELVSLYVFLKQFEKANDVLKPIEHEWLRSREISRWRAVTAFYSHNYSTAYESAKNTIASGLNTIEQNAIAGISAFKLEKFEDAQHFLEFVTSELPSDDNFKLVLAQIYFLKGDAASSYQLLQQGSSESEEYKLLKMQSLQKAISSGFTGLVHSLVANELIADNASSLPSSLINRAQISFQEDIWNANQWIAWGMFQIESNQTEALKSACRNMSSKANSKFVGLLLCSQYELAKHDIPNAKNLLNSASKIDSDAPELTLLKAFVLVKEGNIDKARVLLDNKLQQYPSNASMLTLYADLAASDEHRAYAQNLIQTAITSTPKNQQLQTLLITTLFKYKKYNEVIAVVHEQDYEKNWENGLVSSLYGRSLTNIGAHQKSKAFFLDWLSTYPRNTSALYGVINNLDATNEFLEALGHIERYLALVKDDNVKVYQAYFLTLLSRNLEAKHILDELPKDLKNTHVGLYALASNALFNDQVKLAATLASRAYDASPNLRNLFLYGQVLERLGKSDEINSLLTEHVSQFENDIPAILMLAVRIEVKDINKAIGLYQKVLALDENNRIALNNLAHILLVQSKIVTAKPYVKRLETEHGSFAEGLDTVALFYWKKNDLEKSISVSEKALRLQPNNVLIIKNYIERLADFGNLEQAKRLLRRNESKLNYNDVRDLKSKLDAIG